MALVTPRKAGPVSQMSDIGEVARCSVSALCVSCQRGWCLEVKLAAWALLGLLLTAEPAERAVTSQNSIAMPRQEHVKNA